MYNVILPLKSKEEIYKIDYILENSGNTVVLLPPYKCDLNPIEVAWANNIEICAGKLPRRCEAAKISTSDERRCDTSDKGRLGRVLETHRNSRKPISGKRWELSRGDRPYCH
jgi:hypothetical protein